MLTQDSRKAFCSSTGKVIPRLSRNSICLLISSSFSSSKSLHVLSPNLNLTLPGILNCLYTSHVDSIMASSRQLPINMLWVFNLFSNYIRLSSLSILLLTCRCLKLFISSTISSITLALFSSPRRRGRGVINLAW